MSSTARKKTCPDIIYPDFTIHAPWVYKYAIEYMME